MAEDAGMTEDAGEQDGGVMDAGSDAGVDAGCMAMGASQLGFATAPQTINANAPCSGALKVQLQTACGVPVSAAVNLQVVFSASSASTELFGDSSCIGKPSMFVIPAGASDLDVFFRDSAPGMSTLTATALGVDAGTQVETFVCAAGEKPCKATSCIPMANCCSNTDCGGPKICKATGKCGVPPCSGFVNGCSSFVNYDGGFITIGSSGFSPKCVQAQSFSSVKYTGSLHSLEQTCGNKDLTINKFGSTYTVTGLSGFDTYGFHCGDHPTDVFEVGALKSQ